MMSWRASAPANTAGVWNGRPASESTTRNHRATVSPASRPPTAPCPIRSLMAGLIVPSARTTRTQYHAGPRARNRRRRGLWRSLRDFPFWYLMTGDATTPELPPGLLEDYLEGMRGQLGALARVADHLDADGGDQEALEQLRRETHKIHGSAGSFGFWNASRLAAGMEVTAKDWLSRPGDTDVERGARTRCCCSTWTYRGSTATRSSRHSAGSGRASTGSCSRRCTATRASSCGVSRRARSITS